MSSNLDFVEYVCDQINEAGRVTFKRMFGEYGLYFDQKFFGLICDNQLFVKVTEIGKNQLVNYKLVAPYPNAKDYFLIDEFENVNLSKFIQTTCEALCLPKPKNKLKNKNTMLK